MDIRIVLVEPEHEGNIGSVARLIKNFGLNELWLINPKTEVGKEARVYAVHAKEIIENAVIVNELNEALYGINFVIGTTAIFAKSTSNFLRVSITPEELAKKAILIKGKMALLFGRESKGLSNDELNKCDSIVTIPTNPLYKTLNIATASAIILYELWKTIVKHPKGYFEEASRENRLRLIKLFDQFSVYSLPSYKRKLATRAFQNIISRAFISKREATLIIGVLRKIGQRIS